MGYVSENFDYAVEGETEWFSLYHYGERIAEFKLGGNPEWLPVDDKIDSLFPKAKGESVPTFLRNLKPEGWLADNIKWPSGRLKARLQEDYIAGGLKFLSNFVIVKQGEKHPYFTADYIVEPLASHVDSKGKFTGEFLGPEGSSADSNFEEKLAQFWGNRSTARYSGAELKTPHCLCASGKIDVATDKPFNVLLKHAGRDGLNSLGMNEFMGLSMARAVGLETPDFCVIEQKNGYPPIFAIERYDLPFGREDCQKKRYMTHDFATLMGKLPHQKAEGSIEQVSKKLKELTDSVNPEKTHDSMMQLFRRSVLSWVVNDTDMHLKNLSVIMSYHPEEHGLKRVEFSPSYDITTDVLNKGQDGAQILNIGGAKNKLKMNRFVNLAKSMGLFFDENMTFNADMAQNAVVEIAELASLKALDIYYNPPIGNLSDDIVYDMSVVVSHTVDRAKALGARTPEWNSEAVWNEFKEKSVSARIPKQSRRHQMELGC